MRPRQRQAPLRAPSGTLPAASLPPGCRVHQRLHMSMAPSAHQLRSQLGASSRCGSLHSIPRSSERCTAAWRASAHAAQLSLIMPYCAAATGCRASSASRLTEGALSLALASRASTSCLSSWAGQQDAAAAAQVPTQATAAAHAASPSSPALLLAGSRARQRCTSCTRTSSHIPTIGLSLRAFCCVEI